MPMYDEEEHINYRSEFPPSAIKTKPVPFCPLCGAQMKLRRPKPGQSWSAFWGCNQFPDCKGSRNILSNGSPDMDTVYDTASAGDGYEW